MASLHGNPLRVNSSLPIEPLRRSSPPVVGFGLVLCLALLNAECRPAAAQGKSEPPPERDYPQKYYHSFKGGVARPPALRFSGQGAADYVKFEPEGLRITLPAGASPAQNRSLGLVAGFMVHGDCEITTSFELLVEPTPDEAGSQTRFTLRAALSGPTPNLVTLSRRVAKDGATFFLWSSLVDKATGVEEKKNFALRTAAKTGRLRLVRTGPNIASYVAEGGEGEAFRLVKQLPFGVDDLKEIGIVGATGSPQATLDVRVFDFLVRAEALPGLDGAIAVADSSVPAPAPTMKGWGGVLLIGLVVTLSLALGLWLLVRGRLPKKVEDA